MSTWEWEHDTSGAMHEQIAEIWELKITAQIDPFEYPCVVLPVNHKTWRIVGPRDNYGKFRKERFKTVQQAMVAAKFMYLAGVWK